MDLEASINRLMTEGESRPRFKEVFDTGNEKIFHVIDKTGAQLVSYSKPKRPLHHSFRTLDGFIAYANGIHCIKGEFASAPNTPGTVFVEKHTIRAQVDDDPSEHNIHELNVPLTEAEEYAALMTICHNVCGQKALWRILATDLDGCIDPALLLHVAQADVNVSDKTATKIQTTGVTDIGIGRTINIKTTDGSIQIPESWTYTGRTWECFERRVDIQLRLELDVSDKGALQFRFHPRRLESILNDQRAALVEKLTGTLNPDKWTIYEGTY